MMNGRGAAAMAAVVASSAAVAGFGVAFVLDLRGPQGEPGQQGAPGSHGEPGVRGSAGPVPGPTYTRTDSVFVAPHASKALDVYCDPGDHAIGRGYLSPGNDIDIRWNAPIVGEWSETVAVAGWRFMVMRDSTEAVERSVVGYVVCFPA